ncbi:MAG: hypothetical protein DDT19_02099 [Syntrophomonadaceae bacterium]|nr:hypothetical protein [Bacillota bacterium]
MVAGLSNAQRMESLGFFNAPGASISGNTLRATIGALTLERNMAYGNQTLVAGTGIRIGSFNLRSAAAETINISSYVVSVSVTGAVTLANLSNLRISESTTVRGAVAIGDNAFPVSQAFAANITRTIDVFADVSTAVTSGTIIPSLRITATGASTGEDASVVSAVVGQTITISPSSLVVTLAPATAESGIVVGGTRDVAFATYRFTATNEAFTITDATITVTNPVSLLSLTLGGRTVPVVGTSAVFSGLSISVPRDANTDVAVTANWNTVAAGAGTSGTTSIPTLSAFRATGVQSRVLLDVSATSPTDGTLRSSALTLLGGVAGVTAVTATGNITVGTAVAATAGNVTFTIGPVSYTTAAIAVGTTPAVIAERIRDSIAGHVSPNALATVSGSVVTITSTVSGAAGNTPITIASPQLGATFTSAGLAGGVTGVTPATATGTVTVDGTWRVGDRAIVTVRGNANTHTVITGATASSSIATALAALITTASVANGATASASAGVITIRAITPGIDGNAITLATSQSGPGADVPARAMTLRMTVPTVTSAAGDAALTAGERTVMRVTVAANPAEDVELRTLTFRITTGAATTLASGSVIQVRRDGVIIATSTAAPQGVSTSIDRAVSLAAHADRFVPKNTSRTFEVVVTGITLATGATTLEAQLLGDASAGSTGSFLWRDGSLPAGDVNGFQVRTLPSAGFTLTRN